MKSMLLKPWGFLVPGAVVTTDPAQEGETQISQARWDFLQAEQMLKPIPAPAAPSTSTTPTGKTAAVDGGEKKSEEEEHGA